MVGSVGKESGLYVCSFFPDTIRPPHVDSHCYRANNGGECWKSGLYVCSFFPDTIRPPHVDSHCYGANNGGECWGVKGGREGGPVNGSNEREAKRSASNFPKTEVALAQA